MINEIRKNNFLFNLNKYLNTKKEMFNRKLFSHRFYFDNNLIKYFKFKHLCLVFDIIEQEKGRNKKIEIFNTFLKMIINPHYQNNDFMGKVIILSIPYLTLIQNKNNINLNENENENIKIQYTFENLFKKYILLEFQLTNNYIQQFFLSNGDISKLLLSNFIEKNINSSELLNIDDIINSKLLIINSIGSGSEKEKLQIISNLFQKCSTKIEALYLGRILLNKLRIGLGDKGIIQAIENLSLNIKKLNSSQSYYKNTLEYLKQEIFKYNFSEIELNTNFECGQFFPVSLAQQNDTFNNLIENICSKYFKILVEFKYDGERTQLHYSKIKNIFKLGSRNFENQISLYSDLSIKLKQQLESIIEIDEIILDGEIILFDLNLHKFANFQQLRKKNNSHNLNYFLIVWDILHLNNKHIYELNLNERKNILKQLKFETAKNILVEFGKEINLNNQNLAKQEIINQFNIAKQINCEGLILKQIGNNTKYKFNKRNWIKIKSLSENLDITLDLIPIAATLGKGQNENYFSSFLMAYYDKKSNNLISICKLGIGFTVGDLEEFYTTLSSKIISQPLENYMLPMKSRPNIFFSASEVWEIAFDSFSISSSYPALQGLIDDNLELGISLRFPRFIRKRPDKNIFNSTGTEELIDIFFKSKKNSKYINNPNFNNDI